MAEGIIENETLDQKKVSEVFAPVGKWIHVGNGSGRIQPPVAKPSEAGSSLSDGGVAAATATEGGLT